MLKILALLALGATTFLFAACHDDYDHHRHGYHHGYHGDRVYVAERHDHHGYHRGGTTYRSERAVVVSPHARRVYTY